MATYAEYVEQIAKLHSLAEAVCKNEVNDAIQEVRNLMNLHGATVDDLSAGSCAPRYILQPATGRMSRPRPFKQIIKSLGTDRTPPGNQGPFRSSAP